MAEFDIALKLSSLNGKNGFRIDGEKSYDYTGGTIAGVGDVTGDGFADFIVGAARSNSIPDWRGQAVLVLGSPSQTTVTDLGTLTSSGLAYQIVGSRSHEGLGQSVSSAGDVDGDGIDDILLYSSGGTDFERNFGGNTYLIFGGLQHFEHLDAADGINDNYIAVDNITPEDGFTLQGREFWGDIGGSARAAGDLNGDGFDDIIIGSPSARPETSTNNGSYVIFGNISNLISLDQKSQIDDGIIELSDLTTKNGFRLMENFAQYENFGYSEISVGDVNNDGYDDIVAGANYDGLYFEGAAYLFFGKNTETDNNVEQNIDNSFNVEFVKFYGLNNYNFLGQKVSPAGDLNSDGFSDFIISSSKTSPGATFIVFGRQSWINNVDLNDSNISYGIKVVNRTSIGSCLTHISDAGDVNGDGFDDIIVVESGFSWGSLGSSQDVYVVFGGEYRNRKLIDLSKINGNNGFKIEGIEADELWMIDITNAHGDVNGDGFDDVVIGCREYNNGKPHSGSSFVIFGHRANESVVRKGTEIDNSINGGRGDDRIYGHDGDDVLTGWEGDDRILGGNGADAVNAGRGDDVIIGGDGADRLRGGFGDDRLAGSDGRDLLSGGAGNDWLLGGSDSDILAGGVGNDRYILEGPDQSTSAPTVDKIMEAQVDGGYDTLISSTCNLDFSGLALIECAILLGNASLSIKGNTGNNSLRGNGGNNILTGGGGRDFLTGGGGADIFNFGAGDASPIDAVINDFTLGEDHLNLAMSTATWHLAASGNYLVVESGDITILLRGVTTLTAADFIA